MENLSEDGFERCEKFGDWSTCSSKHWDEDPWDSSGFGDWANFKEGFSEERDSADASPQERQTSGRDHKVERGDEPWTVIYDSFHNEEMVRDTDMTDVLPLSQLLHKSPNTPLPPAAILIKGASFYHHLLCEPKPLRVTCRKPNLHSHKMLTDTLQLKQSDTLQNTDLPHLDFEKPESSSAALIQTKLTAPTWRQNSPGFFYQISRQWVSQYSLRLQNH